jgi:hypothetical protein
MISMLIPFSTSLVAVVGTFLLLTFYLRRRMIARMGSVKGTIMTGMFSPTSTDGGSLKYYCMSCGMQHTLHALCVVRICDRIMIRIFSRWKPK